MEKSLQAIVDFFWTNIEIVASIVGTIASILGAILTVIFSIKAKTAAESANEASKITREQLGKMSILTVLNDCLRLASDLNERLASENWEIIAERATSIRLVMSPMLTSNPEFFTEDLKNKLIQLVGQVKDISTEADKVRFNDKKKPDASRLRMVVSDQREVILIAIEQAKERLASDGANS